MSGGNRRQWFAIRDKLKREGKWDESKLRGVSEKSKGVKRKESASASKSSPKKQRKLTEYINEDQAGFREVTGSEAEEIGALFDQAQGKCSLMTSSFEYGQTNSHFSFESNSDSSDDEIREIFDSNSSALKAELESTNSGVQSKILNSTIPILHERGDLSKEAWEISSAFRRIEISDRTRERIRIAGIPETAGTVRDSTIIIDQTHKPKFYDEIKYDFADLDHMQYEGYFQNFSSLGIVIKALPDDPITTVDLFELLCKNISDPFVIVCEKSKEGVIHWHMIWLTSKRSDNARRILLKIFHSLPGHTSIACQQTRSMKHLCRYILKQPITVGVANNDIFKTYIIGILGEMPYTPKPEEAQFPNEMVKDIITLMKQLNKYTYEELVTNGPHIMQKYLHKPNLESIIHNCRVFLCRPGDTRITIARYTDNLEYTDIFPLWFYLCYQGVEPDIFILDFWNVLFKLTDKRNVLTIQGPSNTGKTTFIRGLGQIFNWGEVVAGGQFMFQNCINKELLFWEEPLIGPDYVEMCKRVFEGIDTQVNIKFKPPQTLHRTPILITTNKDVWHYCDGDEMALRNRMFLYMFTNDASSREQPTKQCIRRAWRLFSKWLANLSQYVANTEPDNPDWTEPSTTTRESTAGGSDRELCEHGISDCSICDTTGECTSRPGSPDTSRKYHKRRGSSSPGQSLKRTKRSGSTEYDSTTVDPSECGTGTTARNTTGRRGQSTFRPALYREFAESRGDCRLGNGFRTGGGTRRDTRSLLKHLYQFRHFGRRYSAIEKIFQESELPVQPKLDRTLCEPVTQQMWLSLIKLGFDIANCFELF